MPYVLRATSLSSAATFRGEYDNKATAIKSARQLRESGFMVTLTGPDGKPINESEPTQEQRW